MNTFILKLSAEVSQAVSGIAETVANPTKADNIKVAFETMGKGMLGIFLALSIVYGFVLLLTWAFPKDKETTTEE
jgi:hypothetical protein